jgi:hypothetical protein
MHYRFYYVFVIWTLETKKYKFRRSMSYAPASLPPTHSGAHDFAGKSLLKDLQRNFRLVIGDLMPRLKDPNEGQIALRLIRAALLPIDTVRLQCLIREYRLAWVGYRVSRGQSTQPVANPICIACPDDCGYAGRYNRAELRQEGTGV